MNYEEWKEKFEDELNDDWKASNGKMSFEVFCLEQWNEREFDRIYNSMEY